MAEDKDNEQQQYSSVSARIPNTLIFALVAALGFGSFSAGTAFGPQVEAEGLQQCLNDAEHALKIAAAASARADTALQVRADHGSELRVLADGLQNTENQIHKLRVELERRTAALYTLAHAADDQRQHEKQHDVLLKTLSNRESWIDRLQRDLDWLLSKHDRDKKHVDNQ